MERTTRQESEREELVFDDEVILPTGMRSEVYASSSLATTSHRDGPEELARRIKRMNTPDYIIDNLFTEGPKANGSTVHEVIALPDGGRISLARPTSPYAEIDVLATAIPAGFESDGLPGGPEGSRPLSWAELPADTGYAYTAGQIELLVAMHRHTANDADKKAVIMQNCTAQLAPVTSQSIGAPHYHATVHNLARFVPEEISVPGMELEEAVAQDESLARRILPRLKRSIRRDLQELGLSDEGLTLMQRHAAPYGFSVVFDGDGAITAENATSEDSLARLHAAKQAVHRRYGQLAQILAGAPVTDDELSERYGVAPERELTTQPSYQELIDISDKTDLVRLTYAPVLQSRAGPVEKCRVNLDRRHDPSLRGGEQAAIDAEYRGYAQIGRSAVAAV